MRFHFSTQDKSNNYGFTLVELLITIAIVTVMISGVALLFSPNQKIGQANDAKRKSDLAQITKALEIYYQDNDRYPPSSGSYTINSFNWGSAWPSYMGTLPKDPSSIRSYVYYTPNSGNCANYQCYYLYASLEKSPGDPQLCFPATGNACQNAAASGLSNSCGATCNYGLASSNTTP